MSAPINFLQRVLLFLLLALSYWPPNPFISAVPVSAFCFPYSPSHLCSLGAGWWWWGASIVLLPKAEKFVCFQKSVAYRPALLQAISSAQMCNPLYTVCITERSKKNPNIRKGAFILHCLYFHPNWMKRQSVQHSGFQKAM